MKNWQEFQLAEPILKRIERRFTKLQNFERRYKSVNAEVHGFSQNDLDETKEIILESIRDEAAMIPGKVYYWLYPFYSGNFLQLVAALGHCGMMERQKDDAESRNAFYQFFKTVPIDERLQLGERLNHPELTDQAIKIQKKIKARKDALRSHLNEHFAN